jgi:galactoside O-acetyltransferase
MAGIFLISTMKFITKLGNYALYDILGHVPARVYLTNNLYIDIGRFSYGAISRVRMFNNSGYSDIAAKFGDFCEFSESRILLGGEHNNSHFNNFSFSSSPPFQKLLAQSNISTKHKRKGILEVGNGVIFSHGSTVLSGVKIGSGVVIGADALITKNCEAFGIYAGNPAKKISIRNVNPNHLEELCNLNPIGIRKYLTNPASLSKGDTIFRSKEDRVILMVQFPNNKDGEGGTFDFRILGAIINNNTFPLVQDSPFYKYCAQATNKVKGKEFEWVLDPLSLKMT